MNNKNRKRVIALFSMLISSTAYSAVPHVYSSGAPILASEMNNNFDNLDGRVNTLETDSTDQGTRINRLETDSTDHGTRINTLETDSTDHGSRINSLEVDHLGIDQRVTAIEAGGATKEIIVNCSADATTLLNTIFEENTTYTLTGMCNGPIEVTASKVTLQGDATGSKDDGITLPAGLTLDTFTGAVSMFGNKRVNLNNLTISAANYTNDINLSATGILVGHGARLEMTDMDIVGGRYGVIVFNNSLARTWGNMQVLDFGREGLTASRNGVIDVSSPITVTGSQTSVETRTYGVSASGGGNIKVREGGVFDAPNGSNIGDPDFGVRVFQAANNGSITAAKGSNTTFDIGIGRLFAWGASSLEVDGAVINGPVRARNSSSMSLTNSTMLRYVRSDQSSSIDMLSSVVTEPLYVRESSSAYIDTTTLNAGMIIGENGSTVLEGTTVAGTIDLYDGGNLRMSNSSHSGGNIWVARGSVLRLESTSVNTTGFGFSVSHGATAGIRGTSSITADNLGLSTYGTLYTRDTPDMGLVPVFCQDQANQITWAGTELNVGDLTGCP